MSAQVTEIPFSESIEELPDANGESVRAGDWVLTDEGPAQVTGLSVTEEHEEGRWEAKTGYVSLDWSFVNLLWPGRASGLVLAWLPGMNFRGDTTGAARPAKVTKLTDAEAIRQARLRGADAEVAALRHALATIQGRLDTALREREQLEASS